MLYRVDHWLSSCKLYDEVRFNYVKISLPVRLLRGVKIFCKTRSIVFDDFDSFGVQSD